MALQFSGLDQSESDVIFRDATAHWAGGDGAVSPEIDPPESSRLSQNRCHSLFFRSHLPTLRRFLSVEYLPQADVDSTITPRRAFYGHRRAVPSRFDELRRRIAT